MDKLWEVPKDQLYSSANTSVNTKKLPRIYSLIEERFSWNKDDVVFDLGSGKGTAHIREFLCKNECIYVPYDPYHFSEEQNKLAVDTVKNFGGADVVVCSNVLNVIREKHIREQVLRQAYEILKSEGVLYIYIYNADNTQKGRCTKEGCWQNNRPTRSYMREVGKVFPQIKRIGDLIIAKKS